MKDSNSGCCRREFLRAVGVTAGSMAIGAAGREANGEAAPGEAPTVGTGAGQPPVVRAAFLYPPSAELRAPGGWWSWPGNDFDAEARQAAYTKKLKEIEQRLEMRIVVDGPLASKQAIAKFIRQVREAKPDGLLLIPFHHSAFGHVDAVLKETGATVSKEGAVTAAGIPTILFSSLGVKHGSVKGYQRPGVYLIQSLDNLEAVEAGLRMIRAAWRMRNSRIISVAGNAEVSETTVPFWGTKVRVLPMKRFVEEVERTPITEAVRELAQAYAKNAKQIREPKEPEILTAAKVHFANRRILEAEKGDAIMIDCLRRGEYMPCMSFMSLRDEGVAAGCENDLGATLTLMLIQELFDRPGFQANPCFETEANHFFASHCTCATKLFGTREPAEPYLLRNYAHTNDPTCVPQVLWRAGEAVTMAHYLAEDPPRMLVYTGTVVKSYEMPPVGGCRTNVAVRINEVDDVCDVKGHHNVLFYGDYGRQLRRFGQLYHLAVEV